MFTVKELTLNPLVDDEATLVTIVDVEATLFSALTLIPFVDVEPCDETVKTTLVF